MARGIVMGATFTKETILKLAKAGVLIIALGTSPYVCHALVKQFFKDATKELIRRRIKKLWELEHRRLISFKELGDGNVRIEITKAGKNLIRLYDLDNLKLKIPPRWDGSWRVISYDIPTGQRRASDAFREKIKQLGLYRLQRSIWISPYECLAEIEFLCAVFNLNFGEQICYFKTRELPKVGKIRAFFNL